MKLGTRSLLFGVHQVVWHPYTVLRAWIALFGWPSFAEFVAIFFHDWGYFGLPNMDGPEGKLHPARSAAIIRWLFRFSRVSALASYEVRRHSRCYCAKHDLTESKLCAADKLCVQFDPEWFYLLRAHLSGEIHEYKANAKKGLTDHEWFRTLRRNSGRFAWGFRNAYLAKGLK